MYRSRGPRCRRPTAGFTLIEVVVALAVVAAVLAAIGGMMATTMRGVRAVDQRLALVTTARTVMAGRPGREKLRPGRLRGELAGHRWQVDVRPYVADFVDPKRPTLWAPVAVAVTVQAPGGLALRIDTVRLLRGSGR